MRVPPRVKNPLAALGLGKQVFTMAGLNCVSALIPDVVNESSLV